MFMCKIYDDFTYTKYCDNGCVRGKPDHSSYCLVEPRKLQKMPACAYNIRIDNRYLEKALFVQE